MPHPPSPARTASGHRLALPGGGRLHLIRLRRGLGLAMALLVAVGLPSRSMSADAEPAPADAAAAGNAAAAEPSPAQLAAGQIWRAKARPEDTEALVTIVMIEDDPTLGRIVHVAITGLSLKNPTAETGLTDHIKHLPFSEAALRSSIGEYIGATDSVPDFRAGYLKWRTARDAGKAGVFEVPLGIVLSAMQGALLDAAKPTATPAQP